MHKLITVVVLVSLSAVGCARRPAGAQMSFVDLLSNNRMNLQRLVVGMDRDEVIAVMGSTPSATADGVVPNPYETEIITRGGTQYEVLYYLTKKYPPFTTIKRSQATPVVLKEGTLVGWGDSALEAVHDEPNPGPTPPTAAKDKPKKK